MCQFNCPYTEVDDDSFDEPLDLKAINVITCDCEETTTLQLGSHYIWVRYRLHYGEVTTILGCYFNYTSLLCTIKLCFTDHQRQGL